MNELEKINFEKIRKSNTVTRDFAIKILGWETKQPKKTKKEINRRKNRDEKYLSKIIKKYSRNKNTLSATYQEEEK